MPGAVRDRVPMSLEDFRALGDDVRAEYLGGVAVMVPSPTRAHQRACAQLTRLLDAAAPPGHEAVPAWSWYVADDFEPIPDVMLVPPTRDQVRFTGRPALVVEVLSTDRAADLVVKAARYAAAGLPAYWVVDLAAREVVAHVLADGVWQEAGRSARGAPAELPFAGGSVFIDVDAL